MAKVLIASIDGNLGYVLGKELEDEGHTVGRIPPDADLAGYLANHRGFDVVLIDLQTSSLSDLRSLRSIRKLFPHIHIIVFSDRVAPQERKSLLASGADKSFMKHELNDLKEHLLRTGIPATAETRPPAPRGTK